MCVVVYGCGCCYVEFKDFFGWNNWILVIFVDKKVWRLNCGVLDVVGVFYFVYMFMFFLI